MKKIFLTFMVAVFAVSAWAEDTPKKPSFAGFVSNGFWDNWEISAGLGGGTAFSNRGNLGSWGDRFGFEGNLSLTLRNTVDRTEYAPSVNMARGKSGIYLRLYVKLPAGMPDGSYEYTLTAGGLLESEGCMTVGRQDVRAVEYVQDMEFRQYGQ